MAACSTPSASPPRGALPAGTAEVTINHATLPATTAVKCTPIGSLTTITTGDSAAGVTALISNQAGLRAKSVSINDLGGFTGSYMDKLDGNAAEVTMAGQTYIIRGGADGFDTDNPSMRTTGTFAIRVAC
ncbi:MAG: lipoprotein LpqH [Mycobacterium sp.]